MKDYDIKLHVQGKSQFTDDLKLPEDSLFASVFTAPASHGKITALDISQALTMEGVIAVFTYKDIPGKNQIGHIIPDEPLLAESIFTYFGQPIAVVVASDQRTARLACKLIKLEYTALPSIFDPRIAYKAGEIIGTERIFSCGDTEKAWDECDYIFSNTVESGAQEHLYLETQISIALPQESNRFKIISSTQSPTSVQTTVADVLGLSMNQIETEVIRLGGAFGGKEDQANQWAALAALSAFKLGKTVKLILSRNTDINSTGKRHPYSSDFKIGLTKDLKIKAYEVTFFQNSGAYADLSTSILERSMFHATNSYFIPNVQAKGICCRTNLPTNTAFRGFGGPQAMFVIESAIYEAAQKLNVSPSEIQQANLISQGESFPYGMLATKNKTQECWHQAVNDFGLEERKQRVNDFNKNHRVIKKGLAVMPVCFGISFTSTFLNQASALVHIYKDGSISISTGAIEMGQGVNEKIRKVAANIFSIPENYIRIETTNTTRTANVSPTAASTGADLNGNATRMACESLLQRLVNAIPKILNSNTKDVYEIRNEAIYQNGILTDLSWKDFIMSAYRDRVNLSAHAFYATPGLFFDKKIEKGNPFAYHVNGTAILEITIDCLRGTFKTDSVEIVHDIGKSLAPIIDRGQVEGALIQGIGWMTMEEIRFSQQGKLMADTLSTYKIPDILSVPDEIKILYPEADENESNFGVFGSKAVGEPPFMYSIGIYFALLEGIRAFNPEAEISYSVPFTNEKLFLMLKANTIF